MCWCVDSRSRTSPVSKQTPGLRHLPDPTILPEPPLTRNKHKTHSIRTSALWDSLRLREGILPLCIAVASHQCRRLSLRATSTAGPSSNSSPFVYRGPVREILRVAQLFGIPVTNLGLIWGNFFCPKGIQIKLSPEAAARFIEWLVYVLSVPPVVRLCFAWHWSLFWRQLLRIWQSSCSGFSPVVAQRVPRCGGGLAAFWRS